MFEQKYIYLILAPDLPELLFTLQIIWFTFSSEPPSLWPEACPEHGQHHGHQHHHGGHHRGHGDHHGPRRAAPALAVHVGEAVLLVAAVLAAADVRGLGEVWHAPGAVLAVQPPHGLAAAQQRALVVLGDGGGVGLHPRLLQTQEALPLLGLHLAGQHEVAAAAGGAGGAVRRLDQLPLAVHHGGGAAAGPHAGVGAAVPLAAGGHGPGRAPEAGAGGVAGGAGEHPEIAASVGVAAVAAPHRPPRAVGRHRAHRGAEEVSILAAPGAAAGSLQRPGHGVARGQLVAVGHAGARVRHPREESANKKYHH